MQNRPSLLFLALLSTLACSLVGPAAPTPTSAPLSESPTVTVEFGGITIDGAPADSAADNGPTPLPAPGEGPENITNRPETGTVIPLSGDAVCRVSNGNAVSNIAVRREPDTSSPLFYAIQPTYTATVLEVRSVPGSLPWFYVRVDNPIETDLEVVEGWIRSDTAVQITPCF